MARKKQEEAEDDLGNESGDSSVSREEKPKKGKKSSDYAKLALQVQEEFKIGSRFMQPKVDEWAVRLKLLNNQKRDKTAIGDPLMFTILQTVLASLYGDRLGVTHLGREEGDEETCSNIDALARFDYEEMENDVLDYEWDFDTCFFGRGLKLIMEFDRKAMCPIPEIIDPMTWIRDPRAKSVNGDRKGRGAMRYGGREIRLTKGQMREAGVYFDFEGLKADSATGREQYDRNVTARREAQGFDNSSKTEESTSGDNSEIRLLEWFTNWNGKKVLVTLGDECKKVVRYQALDTSFWPIVDRPLYPVAHDWDGVSIPDLVEDKQRARASLQNMGLQGIKTGLTPTYLYDFNKIKNKADLNLAMNKHVGVDGNPSGAIQLVPRAEVKAEVGWILETLDAAAQKATATPDIQQGATGGTKRTATELNLVSNKVDTRYSLSAKIWGWSEKRFWKYWYKLYKDHFTAGIDEKVIRIRGAMGFKWRKLTRENIIAVNDPDVVVESRVVAEEIKTNNLQKYRLFLKDIMATDPQSANIRLALRKIGEYSGFQKDEVEQILPPTVDELTAEAENEGLDAGEKVPVNVYDDDFMHMQVHNKAADTPAKFAHINAHRKAMMLKRVNPALDLARNRPTDPQEEANMGAPIASQRAVPGMPAMPIPA